VLLALTTNQKLGLGLTAAVFIAFSLLAALVIPRGNPDFPGKRGLVPFIIVTVILMIAMLSAVEVFAKEEHHGEAAGETTETTTGTTGTSTTPTETTQTQTTPTATSPAAPPPPPAGNPQAGKAVFDANGCGSCHTFSPAGSNGTVGPDLDNALKGKDAAFIHQSIVDPNAEITPGYSAGIMPQTFGQQLSPKQLDDLVAFLQSNQ
jgi:mono/diheme cytochrome c family protein